VGETGRRPGKIIGGDAPGSDVGGPIPKRTRRANTRKPAVRRTVEQVFAAGRARWGVVVLSNGIAKMFSMRSDPAQERGSPCQWPALL
jgi:hypothetical protein